MNSYAYDGSPSCSEVLVSFKYDPFGRRVYKSSSSGTSIYAYDLDNLIEEVNSSGAAVARYAQTTNMDEPLAMLRSSTSSFYQADGLGSVTSLSNAAGALAQTYTFDSFGKLTASSGSLTNPFQYTAREFDSETGLDFYRARYYDQNVGRFLSEDRLGFAMGPDFYVYTANDPVGQIDPSGLQQQGAPVYNPGTWNDPGHVWGNNCYSYACNRLHGPVDPTDPRTWDKPQPGDAAGLPRHDFQNCIEVKVAARADGLKNGNQGNCPCGYHRVRLYFGSHFTSPLYPGQTFNDYHWYRQDSNGEWSSKHGWNPVGPQLPGINDVGRDAAATGYDVFCGTMCAPN